MTTDDTPKSQLILYVDDAGHARVQVRVEDDTVWLTQRQTGTSAPWTWARA